MRNISTLLHRTIAACAIAGALCLSAPAAANTLQTTVWLNGSVALTTHRGATAQNVAAGGFTGIWNTTTPITFWCFDLDHFFSVGSTYTDYTASPLGGGVATQLARLFEEAFGSAGASAVNSAAFQLAVWEIEYDGGSLDVTAGSGFSATGGGANGTAARAQANAWLANLGSYTGASWSISQLLSATHQDFIVGNLPPSKCCKNDVPEPPVLPLVLAAMGAVAMVESRRRLRSRGG